MSTPEIRELLTEREALILGLRLCGHTLQQTGEVFGITRETTRSIESKAWTKIRRPQRRIKTTEEIIRILRG